MIPTSRGYLVYLYARKWNCLQINNYNSNISRKLRGWTNQEAILKNIIIINHCSLISNSQDLPVYYCSVLSTRLVAYNRIYIIIAMVAIVK